MDADRVNQWLTLIANISVVAGIMFLAIEVRQNTESQDEFNRLARANAYQARAFAASSLWSNNASSPELIDAIVAFEDAGGIDRSQEALAALSPQDWWRIRHNALAQLAILDNNFYQYKRGYLDADRYTTIDARMMKGLLPLFDALGFFHHPAMAEEIERLRRE